MTGVILLRLYQVLLVLVAILIAEAVLRREDDLGWQLTGGLVLVPLLLRLFLVK